MRKICHALLLSAILALAACAQSGPRETIDLMAKALEENNPQAFMAQIDMPLFTENYIKNFTNNDSALNSLSALGDMLGLGSLDSLIGSIVDFRAHLERNFNRGITTGELMAQCKTAITPDCPWYPSSLREAKIVELGGGAAIAGVTTPARLSSWIALAKAEKGWRVVGAAAMENEARSMALEAEAAIKAQPGQKPAGNSQNSVNI